MVNLPSILTESTHFYEKYKDQLQPYLNRPYISYSTVSSYLEYREDFVKSKLLGIRNEGGVYVDLGSYLGVAIEEGKFPEENPHGFIGQENVDFDRYRKPNAEYEKLIVIDRGEYIIVGFIDIYYVDEEEVIHVEDNKSGGKDKEKTYTSEDYTQTLLYSHAVDKGQGVEHGVNFFRRTGSHVNPPLKLDKEQFYIPLEYNKKRVDFALKKVDKAVEEISKLKTTYDKFFK